MIDMNTWLISIYTNTIDKIVEIMRNSEEQIESITKIKYNNSQKKSIFYV